MNELERRVRVNEQRIAELHERLVHHQHYLPDTGHLIPFCIDDHRKIVSMDTLRGYLYELMEKVDVLKRENTKLRESNELLYKKIHDFCSVVG